ncbi:MAG: hypothetical protein DMD95_08020 [Candidatus Rokuibacteriota bacterium]|nr:MAG: hypothetical protein DMD95_08020 [Candidatus Rokubacteria bacterium]
MTLSSPRLLQRRCRNSEIGVDGTGNGRAWPPGEVLLASVARPDTTHWLLTIPQAALAGEALTDFLGRVAPFSCPVPGSLIRAYSLPDAPFPSILLKEHDDAPDGIGEAYNRFLSHARHPWLAALAETGPGLCPVLAWQSAPVRRFLAPDERVGALAEAGVTLSGVADGYLGLGLLLLANPDLAASWQTLMSLGGATKIRKITGREFPVWVDLPAHQPALLASPVLARVERLFAEV